MMLLLLGAYPDRLVVVARGLALGIEQPRPVLGLELRLEVPVHVGLPADKPLSTVKLYKQVRPRT
jgi:hypothetical protein